MSSIQDTPVVYSVEQYIAQGDKFYRSGRIAEAEACYRKAISVDRQYAMAYFNLGCVQIRKGDREKAIHNFAMALRLNPKMIPARRNLAVLLVQLKRGDESVALWHAELASGKEGLAWINQQINAALQAKDLWLAGEYASIIAGLRWGSKWYPARNVGPKAIIPAQPPSAVLTLPKLRHDIGQFRYLQDKGILGSDFTPIIEEYEKLIKQLEPKGKEVRVPVDEETHLKIGHVYNRIIHVRKTPRVKKALSDTWDPAAVESQYLGRLPGLVVIDNFLCPEALESMRLFCLESTVWSGNRYAHGRFGAFFNDGFNCPLLQQIAEEVRDAFPNVITPQYPLKQVWGFKNGEYLPPDATIHADFAAINANFWVIPDEANMDKSTGGLVVYGVDAPLGWDFHTYNGRSDIIKSFLKEQDAKAIYIPYRQNRAMIFNSDLFHNTAEVSFRPEYENQRINITLLYGDRENDQHHRNVAQFPDNKSQSSWKPGSLKK
jgi:hypothetical protein